jgi:hypothetical protein
MSNGTMMFSKAVVKGETTYGSGGTADFGASGGRRLTIDPLGTLSLGREYDTGADRSVALRNPVVAGRVTQLTENPEVTLEAPAATTDDLAVYFSMLQKTNAAGTPAGTAAPYTWAIPVGMTSSATAPKSFAAVLGDGNQNYLVNGILPTSLTMGADSSGLTSVSVAAFAKTVTKTAFSTGESLSADARSLPGRLWTASYGTAFLSAGTAGGTAFTHLFDWSLELTSGMAPINAQAGSLSLSDFNQFASAFGGTLSLTVASNPTAVAQLFDKLGSKTFWRLHWEDAGSPSHSADILVCAVPTSVEVMGGDAEGIVTYAAELTLAYDETSESSVTLQVKNGLSALP